MRRRASRPGPINVAISIVVGYVVAILLIPLSMWLLFFWQRPDDPGGAMLFEVARSGFWQLVWWLALVISALVVITPIARFAWSRLTRG